MNYDKIILYYSDNFLYIKLEFRIEIQSIPLFMTWLYMCVELFDVQYYYNWSEVMLLEQ